MLPLPASHPAPPFLGVEGGGPSLHTLSLGHLVKTVIQVLCSPLEGAATPRAHQSDALSEDSASSPVTRLSLMPST